jgi:hypothetical protein
MEKLRQSLTPLTRNILIGVLILLVISVSGSIYLYSKLKQKDKPVDPAVELQEVINNVSKILVLPTNETPTMATVSDPEKLKDQPFFANAKAGDKVLIYTNAQKAILYNPTSNRVVEVAPINAGVTAGQINN